jgi:hypothetical protein
MQQNLPQRGGFRDFVKIVPRHIQKARRDHQVRAPYRVIHNIAAYDIDDRYAGVPSIRLRSSYRFQPKISSVRAWFQTGAGAIGGR